MRNLMISITIQNTISLKDFLQLYLKRFYKKPLVVILTALGILQLALIIIFFVDGNENALNFKPFFSLVAAILPFLGLFMAWQTYRQYLKNGTIEYTLSDEGISAKSSIINWSYSWDKVTKLEDRGKVLFIYINKKSADFISKAALSQEQFTALRALLNNKITAHNIAFVK